LPSAGLVALKRSRASAEAGIKFLLLSAISSAILLYGMVLIYGFTGSSHLNEIADQISRSQNLVSNPAILLAMILITAGFGFKISAAPFQMWAPDVYEGAPTPITAFLSVASKSAGFALAIRIFYTVFNGTEISVEWGQIIAILSALSMTLGNLIAIRQNNIKRLLAYSTVAQAGYIMVGLASMSMLDGTSNLGLSGILFYLAGYAMTNLTAFGIIILVCSKSENYSLEKFSDLARISPVLAIAMTLSMVSLIGIPPTVGFIGKVYLFSAAMESGLIWLAIFGVLNSVISAYYYLNIVRIMFKRSSKNDSYEKRPSIPLKIGGVAVILSAIATFVFGLYPEPILNLANTAIQSII
jgi:NADH-quinone oxidoreductase subunit N